jgi:acylphosphatase
MKKFKLTVGGLVQGVGFRYFCYKKANEYGIKGYVKNLYNGKVELEIEGDDNLIKDYIIEIKIGPAFADVKTVDITELEYKNEYKDFFIY